MEEIGQSGVMEQTKKCVQGLNTHQTERCKENTMHITSYMSCGYNCGPQQEGPGFNFFVFVFVGPYESLLGPLVSSNSPKPSSPFQGAFVYLLPTGISFRTSHMIG